MEHSKFTSPELYEREESCYRLLSSLSIPFERCEHPAADTIEACAGAEQMLGHEICKNLFLCNRNKTRYYLLLLPGKKVFKTKYLSAQIGSSRLSFASGEDMLELLGLAPGSVSILGLKNDLENRVTLLIDEDILSDETICCHPCVNTATLKLRTTDMLERFLPFVSHSYQSVFLPAGTDDETES